MAGPAEIQEMQDWASDAFDGQRSPGHEPAVRVELRRQDYNSLGFGESCMETPLKIGQRRFKHGLGTHAFSEIILHLPPGAKEFKAFVGIDNNFDTEGVRGSVRFSVEVAGKQVFRTRTLRGTNAPVRVNVALPDGTRELTLKVDPTADGPSYDQADWADACIVTADGTVCWADEDRPPFTASATPFSFRYGGAASATFLRNWRHAAATTETSTRIIQISELDRPRHQPAGERNGHCVQALPGSRVGAEVRGPRHARHPVDSGRAGARCPTAHGLHPQAGPVAPPEWRRLRRAVVPAPRYRGRAGQARDAGSGRRTLVERRVPILQRPVWRRGHDHRHRLVGPVAGRP